MGQPEDKEVILQWLQQNAGQSVPVTGYGFTPEDEANLARMRGDLGNLTAFSTGTATPKIFADPLTLRDVERLIEDVVEELWARNFIQGSLNEETGKLIGHEIELARITVPKIFLTGNAAGLKLPTKFVTGFNAVLPEIRAIAKKYPQAPTSGRQYVEYIRAAHRAFVTSGIVDERFWQQMLATGGSATDEQVAFFENINNSFYAARDQVVFDTALVDTEHDIGGRFLRAINTHEIEPRQNGAQFGDPDTDFWVRTPDETPGQLQRQRQEEAAAAQDELARTDPGKWFDQQTSNLPTQAELSTTEWTALKAWTARARREVIAARDAALANGLEPTAVVDAVAQSMQQFVAQLGPEFDSRVSAAIFKQDSEEILNQIADFPTARATAAKILESIGADVNETGIEFVARELEAIFLSYDPSEGKLPPDLREIVIGLSPLATRISAGREIQEETEAAEAAEAAITPEQFVRRELIRAGIITPQASRNFLSRLETNVIPRIATAMTIALNLNPKLERRDFVASELGKTHPRDIKESFLDRLRQGEHRRTGPSSTPFRVQGQPQKPQGLFSEQLAGEAERPGFLNFLLGEQIGLETEFETELRRAEAERTQDIGARLPGNVVPGVTIQRLTEGLEEIDWANWQETTAGRQGVPPPYMTTGKITDLTPADARYLASQISKARGPSTTPAAWFAEKRPGLLERFGITAPGGQQADEQEAARRRRRPRTVTRRAAV